jgi:hypothetical protein
MVQCFFWVDAHTALSHEEAERWGPSYGEATLRLQVVNFIYPCYKSVAMRREICNLPLKRQLQSQITVVGSERGRV